VSSLWSNRTLTCKFSLIDRRFIGVRMMMATPWSSWRSTCHHRHHRHMQHHLIFLLLTLLCIGLLDISMMSSSFFYVRGHSESQTNDAGFLFDHDHNTFSLPMDLNVALVGFRGNGQKRVFINSMDFEQSLKYSMEAIRSVTYYTHPFLNFDNIRACLHRHVLRQVKHLVFNMIWHIMFIIFQVIH
jgi:hypothetical protein